MLSKSSSDRERQSEEGRGHSSTDRMPHAKAGLKWVLFLAKVCFGRSVRKLGWLDSYGEV